MATAGPTDLPLLIKELNAALIDEIKGKNRGEGGKKVRIFNGELKPSNEKVFEYKFYINQDLNIPDDSPVNIIISNKTVNGTLVTTNEDIIIVTLTEFIGNHIQTAELVFSETRLLEILVEKISSLTERLEPSTTDQIGYNINGCSKVFGFIEPGFLTSEVYSFDLSGITPPPNDEQKKAIECSLSQEVTFVWGPPGTGKTKTLSVILELLVKSGKTVLLTSNTNLAVDEVLEKYLINSEKNEFKDEIRSQIDIGKIIRLGSPAKLDSKLQEITLDNVTLRVTENHTQEKRSFEGEIDTLKKRTAVLDSPEIQQNLNQLDEKYRKYDSLNNSINAISEDIQRNKTSREHYWDQCTVTRNKIQDFNNASFFTKLFSATSVESLSHELQILERSLSVTDGKLSELVHQQTKTNQLIQETELDRHAINSMLREVLKKAGIGTLPEISRKAIKELRDSLNVNIRETAVKVMDIDQTIDKVRKNILLNSQVVACTLTRAYIDSKVQTKNFDVLIIDEASMALLPAIFFVSTIVKTHYVITGDFRQLPPIATSKTPIAEKWLKRDIFSQAGIVQSANYQLEDKRLVMLPEQHRMHPAIMDIINQPMYNGKLIAGERALTEIPKLTALPPFENHPVILIDTSSLNPRIFFADSSRMNLYSAMLGIQITKKILEESKQELDVGIISTYKPQAKFIADLLEEEHIPKKSAMAATVHKFQGNERSCIIFDLVDGPPEKAGKPVMGTFRESDAGKLINVAVSRAKGKLIIIANVDYFLDFKLSKLNDSDAVIELLKKVRQTGFVIDAKDFFSPNAISDVEYTPPKDLNETGKLLPILDQNNFYTAFEYDIRRAKKRIVIHSPFVGMNRSKKLMDIFSDVIANGVNIYAIIQNPKIRNDMRVNNVIDELKSIGVSIIIGQPNVGLHYKLHEKFALIDDFVFYYGSLNILSQWDSSETMVAYRSQKIIAQLVKHFKIENIIQKSEKLGGIKAAARAPQNQKYIPVNTGTSPYQSTDTQIPGLSAGSPITPAAMGKSIYDSLAQIFPEQYSEWKFIGEGGFGRVYKAKRKDGTFVAIKIPSKNDASTGKSFLSEMQNLKKLNHQNIVRVSDFNIMPVPYFEMELCDSSLAVLKNPLQSDEAARLIFSICSGLKYAHDNSIIHRDLKPENILLKEDIPKISDWGLSKIISESTSVNVSNLTPYYAAPEQFNNKPKDERTDIWQMGVIFYELITGARPFEGGTLIEVGANISNAKPKFPSEVNPDAKPLDLIVMKCLEKDPDCRYPTVFEFQKDLGRYLQLNCTLALKKSVNVKDFRRSSLYCGDLVIFSMQKGDLAAAYMYVSDFVNYARGDTKEDASELLNQIRFRIEQGITEPPEELMQKAEFMVHKVRLNLSR
jgi:superfamily I DNA and/or RNA helicase